MNKLKGTKYFTKLDVQWGYNNIWIKEGDKWKAAFLTNRGLFEPLVMFFGLTNSPATFQTMMNELLQDLINTGKVLVYIDDILIFTNNLDKHCKLVHQVLSILSANKLYLKPEKCTSGTHFMALLSLHDYPGMSGLTSPKTLVCDKDLVRPGGQVGLTNSQSTDWSDQLIPIHVGQTNSYLYQVGQTNSHLYQVGLTNLAYLY